MRRVGPALALFFLAPLVAEFFLGDFALTALPLVLLLAPLYGGGALLIRELTRRAGRGWPTILLLALAFGVLEEGLLTQSLFNPGYVDHHLLAHGLVPWAVFVLGLHTVWSIGTPILLVEESMPARRTAPWLRTPGLVVTAAVFAAGAFFTFTTSYADGHFLASPGRLAAAAVVVVALVAGAFLLPRPDRRRVAPAGPPAPGPWPVFATALAAGAMFMGGRALTGWPGVPFLLVALAGTGWLVARWSARPGWDHRQRYALAAGALLTYTWHAFTTSPVRPVGPGLNLVSHVAYALAALALLWWVGRLAARHGSALRNGSWAVRNSHP